jgi:glutamate-1-semialdehyde 2,1-aminomutase
MPERTDAERALLNRAAEVFPGGYTGNLALDEAHRFIIRGGKGSKVWDVSGNEYIDYLNGSGPMVLGHAHPAVVAAVIAAAEQGSTFFATNEQAVLLAEEIVKAVPCGDKIRFTTSGTDACLQCMRIARSYRKRDKILKFEGGYHGTSEYGLMSMFPRADQLPEYPEPVANSAGIPKVIGETILVAPYNNIETATAIIESHHDELAGVIVEPMQRILAPKPGFLQALRDATAQYDIPLIFDEVVTGFRLAYGGAQEYYGVTPDLASYGKIVGGGYPLAVVAGREELMSTFDSSLVDQDSYVPQIGTLNGNAVACAAGLATLSEMRKEGSYERLHGTGRKLRDALERLCGDAGITIQPSGEDVMFGFYFSDRPMVNYRDTLLADTAMMAAFNATLLEEGILKSMPDKFYPSLAITDEDIDRTIEVFSHAIDKLRG